MHYVVQLEDGSFQGLRNEKVAHYMVRTPKEGVELAKARIFNTKGAATTSMRHAGIEGTVVPVEVTL